MRVVFIGASELAVHAANLLINRGDQVVIIEKDKEKIDNLSDELDCSFLHGDASKPAILNETAPEKTDVLFCLANNDRVNIIASLIGKNLGFKRVVTKIEDAELEDICLELGLEDTIIPSQTIGRFLADLVRGPEILELSTLIKGEARFFSFVINESDSGKSVKELDLPEKSKAISLYRKDRFLFTEEETELKKQDELVILTHSENLPELRRRWAPERSRQEPSDEAADIKNDKKK